MSRLSFLVTVLMLMGMAGTASAGTTEHTLNTGWFTYSNDRTLHVAPWENRDTQYTVFWYVQASNSLYPDENPSGSSAYCGIRPHLEDYIWLTSDPSPPESMCGGTLYYCSYSGGVSGHSIGYSYLLDVRRLFSGSGNTRINISATVIESTDFYNLTGSIGCIDNIHLYINHSDEWNIIADDTVTGNSSYDYPIILGYDYRIVLDGAYYDFTCDGHEVFDYDACTWVYGYTCGVDTIKLYKDDGGWILEDSVGQSTGYDVYEMEIVDGEDYKISFIDSTIDGDFVVHNQTFSCTGDHVLIDFDRCEWIYPPNPPAPPYIIYLWTGYDYNIVVFKDAHGNFIENSQLSIYDKTDNQYLQRWTDASDGYALLGAKFATDHDVLLSLRTFDGIFTLDTTFPANGSAAVGEEDITTTNWTIPIKYNLNVLPVDQYGVSLFDVFCGLSEYTPLNPGAFWGMDLSDRGYVPVTNCSGFAMCDIIAEKEGYADYKVEALNWTSKSALVKDYRHNVVMEEE